MTAISRPLFSEMSSYPAKRHQRQKWRGGVGSNQWMFRNPPWAIDVRTWCRTPSLLPYHMERYSLWEKIMLNRCETIMHVHLLLIFLFALRSQNFVAVLINVIRCIWIHRFHKSSHKNIAHCCRSGLKLDFGFKRQFLRHMNCQGVGLSGCLHIFV